MASCFLPSLSSLYRSSRSPQLAALLQSENNQVLVQDIALDWLNPMVVMANRYNVPPSLLEQRSKVMRSMTELQRQRLSNMLIALNSGLYSFSSTNAQTIYLECILALLPSSLPVRLLCCRSVCCRDSDCSSRRCFCAGISAYHLILFHHRLRVLFHIPSESPLMLRPHVFTEDTIRAALLSAVFSLHVV